MPQYQEPGLKARFFCALFPGLKAGASTVVPLRGTLRGVVLSHPIRDEAADKGGAPRGGALKRWGAQAVGHAEARHPRNKGGPIALVLYPESSTGTSGVCSLSNSDSNDGCRPGELSYARLLLRESEPLNLESPFSALDERVTPNELFYVRSHFPAPEIDASAWRLTVRGEREVSFSLDELRRMPAETRTVTLECAGNGRIVLTPAVDGVQWHLGAVSTAEWTGVPLTTALERAGVPAGSVEVVMEGADRGEPRKTPRPPQPIAYAHGVPMEHAGDVLLAWAMNGEALTREHGFPLRAVASGYYAMVAVKWLTRIAVLGEAFQGYYKTTDYSYWDETRGQPELRPLGLMPLKSQIARPVAGEVLRAGETVTVAGAAWTGGAAVERVEVSADGGETWSAAQILDPHEHGVWRRWQWTWRVPREAGEYALMSRAVDREGRMQPAERDPRFGTYCIHHVVEVRVRVR